MVRYSFLVWVLLVGVGCSLPEVRVNVLSERTTLENQVLGSYNSLVSDVLLVASVRGVDPLGRIEAPPRKSREHEDAVEAVQVLAFHSDDVDAFKRLGWVGENNRGFLTPFSLSREHVPDDLKEFAARYKEDEFRSVVRDVNAARKKIMRRVLDLNANFTPRDLPKVERIFARINAENAASGVRIQKEDGTWVRKP